MRETQRSYHPNGTLRFESDFVDGLPDGVQRHWHPNGVLAKQYNFVNGLFDGDQSEWNENGELLGTFHMEQGTGLFFSWHENGQVNIEFYQINGGYSGRQVFYWPDGKIVAVHYYINNSKVTKKKYGEACKTNLQLPQYDEDLRAGKLKFKTSIQKKLWPTKPGVTDSTAEIKRSEELCLDLLNKNETREALQWLTETPAESRTLGENWSEEESTEFVKKLYGFGAIRVSVIDIDRDEKERAENAGKLVIELPSDCSQRKPIFKRIARIATKLGFDAEKDHGQKYLFVMLD